MNIKNTASKLWQVFRSNFSTDDIDLLLFLIVLRRNADSWTSFESNLNKAVHTADNQITIVQVSNLPEELQKHYNKILAYGSISSINNNPIQIIQGLRECISTLDQFSFIDPSELAVLFDLILAESIKSKKDFGEHLIPLELAALMTLLLDADEQGIIFNPFSSYGSLILKGSILNQYLGIENDVKKFWISQLRMIAYDRTQKVKLIHEDPINYLMLKVKDESNIEYLISTPPPNLRLSHDTESNIELFNETAETLLLNLVDSKKLARKAVVFVTDSTLHSSRTKTLRERLVSQGLIKEVISLPTGLMGSNSLQSNLVVIDREDKDNQSIHFIDASEAFNEPKRGDRTFSMDLYKGLKTDSDFSATISPEVLSEHENILTPRRYTGNKSYLSKSEEMVSIRDILDFKSWKSEESGADQEIFRISNLIDNQDFPKINPPALQLHESTNKSRFRRIDESAIILSSIGGQLKPNWFEYTGKPLFVSPDVIAGKFKKGSIDYEYLLYELNRDHVIEQVQALSAGSIMSRISSKEVERVKIRLVDLNDQLAIVRGAKEIIYKEKQAELEEEKERLGIKDQIDLQNKFLRHQIAGPISNLQGTSGLIKEIIDNCIIQIIPNAYELRAKHSDPLNLKDLLNILETNTITIKNRVSQIVKNVNDISKAELEPLKFIKLLKKYCHENNGVNPDFEVRYKFSFLGNYESLRIPEEDGIRSSLGDKINDLMEDKVDEYFQNFENSIQITSDYSNSFESLFHYIKNDNELQKLDLSTKKGSENLLGHIKQYVETNHLIKEEILDLLLDDIIEVKGNEDLLRIMFDNFVQNAFLHAIKDSDMNENHFIQFELRINQDLKSLELWISNSGKFLPKGFSIEKFKLSGGKAGSNAGSGLGGNIIYETVLKHKGKLSVLDGMNGGLEEQESTCFIIELPIQINI